MENNDVSSPPRPCAVNQTRGCSNGLIAVPLGLSGRTARDLASAILRLILGRESCGKAADRSQRVPEYHILEQVSESTYTSDPYFYGIFSVFYYFRYIAFIAM
jgi:hypothetical protein